MKIKNLTFAEIEQFSTRKGVKAIAVENFLSSCEGELSHALGNLRQDARVYRWNAATVKAIEAGLKLAQVK